MTQIRRAVDGQKYDRTVGVAGAGWVFNVMASRPGDTRVTQAEILALVPPSLGERMDPASPLLSLNNAHAKELSLLDPGRMAHLVREAFMASRIGEADALLLAFDQDADYDSPNFLWFRNRFDRFVYIDRVVVDPGKRGHGLARALYDVLFARAASAGHCRVVCEVNANPPNPASNAFHAALGFEDIGSAVLAGGAKTVRYFARPL